MPMGQIGSQRRMLFDSALPFDASSFWLEYISDGIVQDIPVVNNAGIRGTRTHASERNRWGNETVSGTLEVEASRQMLDNFLPCILGKAEAANVFDVDENIPAFYLLADHKMDAATVSECKVSTCTFSLAQSEIVRMSIGIEAESMTWGAIWPSPAPSPDISKPYFFSDLGNVTIGGNARQVFTAEITVDNVLVADQFANQLTRDGLLNPSDRIVTVNLTVPATTANKDLLAGNALSGEALSFVLTNADEASSVLTITLGRCTFNKGQSATNGKGQQVIQLNGISRGLGHAGATAKDISITNAHAS